MQLTISQAALSRAMQVVTKAIATNATVPIIGGVLVDAEDGRVTLAATDLSKSICTTVPANVEEEGRTVIPGKLVTNAVKAMPDEAVTLKADGSRMTVSCGKSTLSVATLDPRDFPEFPVVEPERSVTLPCGVLLAMAAKVHRVTSKDRSRPVLSGVQVVVGDGRAQMVATDSYRLAVCTREVGGDAEFEAIIPGANLHEALSIPAPEDDVTLGLSETQVCVTSGRVTYVSRRIEGNFPAWRQLMPTSHTTELTFDSEEMLRAAKRVSVVASSSAPTMTMATHEGSLLPEVAIMANSDRGEANETVPAECGGSAISMHFNSRFVTEAMEAMDGECVMEANGPTQPAVFSSHGEVESKVLLMPVRG